MVDANVTSAVEAERGRVTSGRQQVQVVIGPARSALHLQAERQLVRAGGCYPLAHRFAWRERFGSSDDLFCCAAVDGEPCRAGFVVDAARTRALPGHRVLRVTRYTPPRDEDTHRALVGSLVRLASRDRRILRLGLELFCADEDGRRSAERDLAGLGFAKREPPRRYEHTLAVDLRPEEGALFTGLHKTARRNIREVQKRPVEVRVIADSVWAPRIERLLTESMQRTGGHVVEQRWAPRITFSRVYPELSRIVGLFRTDVSGEESLIAFAWGCNDGEYAHYDASGATRRSVRGVSMAYPLLWDLICWAKRGGASWFDLGGVTPGHLDDGVDALGGISDFKRYFSRNVVRVGGEWVLEPRPLRARLARFIGRSGRKLRERAGAERGALVRKNDQ